MGLERRESKASGREYWVSNGPTALRDIQAYLNPSFTELTGYFAPVITFNYFSVFWTGVLEARSSIALSGQSGPLTSIRLVQFPKDRSFELLINERDAYDGRYMERNLHKWQHHDLLSGLDNGGVHEIAEIWDTICGRLSNEDDTWA